MTGPHFEDILQAERRRRGGRLHWSGRCFWIVLLAVVFVASWHTARVGPVKLWDSLPRLLVWLRRMWPPDFTEWSEFGVALWETLAIAIIGTSFAVVAAGPLALVTARTTRPWPWLALLVRGLLNFLRAIDTLIFALFFVSVVGLGPFAGVLGVACHTTGSMGKLYTELLESIPEQTSEAVAATGAGRLRTFLYAVLPDALPGVGGITVYLWEFNVRASVILGIVGAGGIGYELVVSIKLLDFPRLAVILMLIMVVVTALDTGSVWLRKRLA